MYDRVEKNNMMQHRYRSYVIRNSRITASQTHAYETMHASFNIASDEISDYSRVFERDAPTFLEIGFGTGLSLLAAATTMPDYNFIGVETHRPGIGALLKGIHAQNLKNLRFYQGDVVDIISAIPEQSLAGIQIFFPDPWPKRKHHPRRLIQCEFIERLIVKLQPNGTLHLATDWEDYAQHMLAVLKQVKGLTNLSTDQAFTSRSIYRPIVSKFERRALDEGRAIWELQFAKR